MSMHHREIPYPAPFDHAAAHEEERRRLALAKLHPEDVLAAVMEDLAERPLQDHPLQGLLLFDGLKAAVVQAVERLLDERLAMED
jgi:hypothetical protein